MMKSSIGAVFLFFAILFFADLATGQAEAAPPYPIPSRSVSSDCATSKSSALGDCRGATIRTIDYAIRNSRAQANRANKRASRATVKEYPEYAIARQKLIRAGWQPVSNPGADPCEKGDTRCEGKPEMQSCSGTGEANCVFLWRRNRRVREVNTIKDPPVVTYARSCALRLNEREIQLCSSLPRKKGLGHRAKRQLR